MILSTLKRIRCFDAKKFNDNISMLRTIIFWKRYDVAVIKLLMMYVEGIFLVKICNYIRPDVSVTPFAVICNGVRDEAGSKRNASRKVAVSAGTSRISAKLCPHLVRCSFTAPHRQSTGSNGGSS